MAAFAKSSLNSKCPTPSKGSLIDRVTSKDTAKDDYVLRRLNENPELRAFDWVLIDLTPYGAAPKENNANSGRPASEAANSSAAASGDQSSNTSAVPGAGASNGEKDRPSDFGRIQMPAPKSPQEGQAGVISGIAYSKAIRTS